MLTATRCRELVEMYRVQANERDMAPRRVTLLRNIAHSLSGLASQLDMLADDMKEDRRGAKHDG